MPRKRRSFTAQFKAKVALEAVKNLKSISELSQQHQVHPNQITLWKKHLIEKAEEVFEGGEKKALKGEEPEVAELYEQIGRLKVQLDFIKKKVAEHGG